MNQLDVFGGTAPAPDEPVLTERQAFVLELLRDAPGGLSADEVGAALCERKGKHSRDVRCDWCGTNGKGVLRSKALGPLVIRTRGDGLWRLRDAPAPEKPANAENGAYDPTPAEIPY